METLAYLHLALAHETATDVGLREGVDWRKFSNQTWTYLLPALVAFTVLGMAKQSLAQTIEQGARGSQVTVIQERLQQLGYFNQTPTGTFGSVTKDAVIQFQQANGLNPDGVVGSRTLDTLFSTSARPAQSYSTPYPAQSYNAPYPAQSYNAPYTGTDAGTPNFDTDLGSEAFRTSRGTDQLRRGDRGPAVRLLQERLSDRGFYLGLIDGIYGSGTESAVTQFQYRNKLYPDGVAGSATLAALGIIDTNSRRSSYVVVVPMSNENTLFEVQQYAPRAVSANSSRGKFVNAGNFPKRAEAESLSSQLRSRGFDARVTYIR
jgi:peptidoglycan hydrolase-like protein with peptidoglycan-binding domain